MKAAKSSEKSGLFFVFNTIQQQFNIFDFLAYFSTY